MKPQIVRDLLAQRDRYFAMADHFSVGPQEARELNAKGQAFIEAAELVEIYLKTSPEKKRGAK